MRKSRIAKRQRYYLPEPYQHVYLTAREWELFQCLGRGSCTVLARQLGISLRTVQDHAKKMRIKLHCDSIQQLVALRDQLRLDDYCITQRVSNTTTIINHTRNHHHE